MLSISGTGLSSIHKAVNGAEKVLQFVQILIDGFQTGFLGWVHGRGETQWAPEEGLAPEGTRWGGESQLGVREMV